MLVKGTSWFRGLASAGALSFLVFALNVSAAESSYVVKRNDTLSGIARQHGVSTAKLAERNGLSKSAHVYVGQRLVIPSNASRRPQPQASRSAPPRSEPADHEAAEKAVAGPTISRGRWKYIVVHHSGVDTGNIRAMDRYHREERHMENGLAYHFVIGNGSGMKDGEVAAGRRWREQLDGGHLRSEAQNKVSIGICLVGNFDQDKPTAKQMQSLNALVDALLARCRLSGGAVKTHREINVIGTRCPGKHFPSAAFLKDVRARRGRAETARR